MSVRNFTNLPTLRTLSAAINSSVLTFTVSGASPLAADLVPPFTAVIDRGLASEEVVLVNAFTGSSPATVVVTRGWGNTAAVSHSLGASFEHCLVAEDFEEGGTGYLSAAAIPTWRAAYANRRSSRAVIATIGDSVQEGLGATSQNNGYLQRLADQVSWAQPLLPHAFKSASKNSNTWVSEWTFGGSGTEADNKWYGIGLKTIDLPSTRTMTTTFYGTSVQAHFATDLGHGTPTITIDGVSYTGPNLSTGSFGDGVIWSSVPLSRGLHTITIGPSTAAIRFSGMKAFDGDESAGVHVYPGGRSGTTVQDWAQDQFGNPVTGAQAWPKAYAVVNPHLVIIAMGHNDYFFQTVPSTFQTKLQQMIDLVKAQTTADPSFLLEIYPKRADDPGTITYNWEQYVAAIKAVAAANVDTTVLDFRDFMGSAVGSDPYDLYFDNVHPNDKGYQRMSDITADALDFEHDRSTAERNALPELTLVNEHSTSTPVAPVSGLKFFARNRARRLPAFIGPSGQDSQLQPALFSNSTARVNAINNVSSPNVDGVAVTHLHNATATPIGVALSAGNQFTSSRRYRLFTTTTAGTSASTRVNTAQWFTSSTVNMGGFFLVMRFGIDSVAATGRGFFGMSSTVGAFASANPSTFTNMMGFAFDSSQTTFRWMNNAASTTTTVDLGSNFPSNTASTHFYEARIFAASGAGNAIFWSMQRVNDGIVSQGSVTTNLPAVGTLLAPQLWYNNGTTAAQAGIAIQSIYVETDN